MMYKMHFDEKKKNTFLWNIIYSASQKRKKKSKIVMKEE